HRLSSRGTAMLVLSRRLKERILFPDLGAAVEVLAIRSGVVRLGIQAPPGVLVLREELAASPGASPSAAAAVGPPSGDSLRAAAKGLLQLRQLAGNLSPAAARALDALEQEVHALRQPNRAERPTRAARGEAPKALLVEDNANEREL